MYGRRGVVDACFQLILIHSDTFSMYMHAWFIILLVTVCKLPRIIEVQ